MLTIAVFGAKGRVGSRVCRLAVERGYKIVPIDVDTTEAELQNARADVAIDFALPCATERVCGFCRQRRIPLVTGVTGRNATEQGLVEQLARHVKVVEKDNFAQGVEVLTRLVQVASEALAGWECEIVEAHRRGKKDAPSGTARMLAAKIAEKKNFGTVTVHSLRLGDETGTHTVVFAARGETVTISHRAVSIDIFARGALDAAVRVCGAACPPPASGKDS